MTEVFELEPKLILAQTLWKELEASTSRHIMKIVTLLKPSNINCCTSVDTLTSGMPLSVCIHRPREGQVS
eukprot:9647856-Karenia_brevis.AAC.1